MGSNKLPAAILGVQLSADDLRSAKAEMQRGLDDLRQQVVNNNARLAALREQAAKAATTTTRNQITDEIRAIQTGSAQIRAEIQARAASLRQFAATIPKIPLQVEVKTVGLEALKGIREVIGLQLGPLNEVSYKVTSLIGLFKTFGEISRSVFGGGTGAKSILPQLPVLPTALDVAGAAAFSKLSRGKASAADVAILQQNLAATQAQAKADAQAAIAAGAVAEKSDVLLEKQRLRRDATIANTSATKADIDYARQQVTAANATAVADFKAAQALEAKAKSGDQAARSLQAQLSTAKVSAGVTQTDQVAIAQQLTGALKTQAVVQAEEAVAARGAADAALLNVAAKKAQAAQVLTNVSATQKERDVAVASVQAAEQEAAQAVRYAEVKAAQARDTVEAQKVVQVEAEKQTKALASQIPLLERTSVAANANAKAKEALAVSDRIAAQAAQKTADVANLAYQNARQGVAVAEEAFGANSQEAASAIKAADAALIKAKAENANADATKRAAIASEQAAGAANLEADQALVQASSAKVLAGGAAEAEAGTAGLTRGLVGAGIAAAGAVVVIGGVTAGLVELGKSAAEEELHMEILAEKLGVTTKQLQEFQLIAKTSGTETEGLAKAFSQLEHRALAGGSPEEGPIDEAKMKSSQRILHELGIEFENTAQKAAETGQKYRSVRDIVFDLSEVFHALGPGIDANTLAWELMGRQGLQNVHVFLQGRDALEEMAGKADEMSTRINQEHIKALHEYEAATNQLNQAWLQFKQSIADTGAFSLLTAVLGGMARNLRAVTDLFTGYRRLTDGISEDTKGVVDKLARFDSIQKQLNDELAKVNPNSAKYKELSEGLAEVKKQSDELRNSNALTAAGFGTLTEKGEALRKELTAKAAEEAKRTVVRQPGETIGAAERRAVSTVPDTVKKQLADAQAAQQAIYQSKRDQIQADATLSADQQKAKLTALEQLQIAKQLTDDKKASNAEDENRARIEKILANARKNPEHGETAAQKAQFEAEAAQKLTDLLGRQGEKEKDLQDQIRDHGLAVKELTKQYENAEAALHRSARGSEAEKLAKDALSNTYGRLSREVSALAAAENKYAEEQKKEAEGNERLAELRQRLADVIAKSQGKEEDPTERLNRTKTAYEEQAAAVAKLEPRYVSLFYAINKGNVDYAAEADILDQLKKKYPELVRALEQYVEAQQKIIDGNEKQRKLTEEAAGSVTEFEQKLRQLGISTQTLGPGRGLENLKDQIDEETVELNKNIVVLQDATSEVLRLEAAHKLTAEAVQEFKKAESDVATSVGKLDELNKKAADSTLTIGKAFDEVQKVVGTFGVGLPKALVQAVALLKIAQDLSKYSIKPINTPKIDIKQQIPGLEKVEKAISSKDAPLVISTDALAGTERDAIKAAIDQTVAVKDNTLALKTAGATNPQGQPNVLGQAAPLASTEVTPSTDIFAGQVPGADAAGALAKALGGVALGPAAPAGNAVSLAGSTASGGGGISSILKGLVGGKKPANTGAGALGPIAGFAGFGGSIGGKVGGTLGAVGGALGGAAGGIAALGAGAFGGLGSLGFLAAAAGPLAAVAAPLLAIGIYEQKQKAATAKLAKSISDSFKRVVDNLNNGNVTLIEALKDTQAKRDQAVAQLSGRKGGKEALKALLPEFDQQIEQIKKQQRDLVAAFNLDLATLRFPQGIQDTVKSLEDLNKQIKEFVDAGGSAAEAAEFFARSLAQIKTSTATDLLNAEQSTVQALLQEIDLQKQKKQLISDELAQEQQILNQGVVSRERSQAQQQASQIQALRKQRDDQLRNINQQLDMTKAQIGGQQQLFGLTNDRNTLLQRQVEIQTQLTAQTTAQLQAEEQLLTVLGKITPGTSQADLNKILQGVGGATPTTVPNAPGDLFQTAQDVTAQITAISQQFIALLKTNSRGKDILRVLFGSANPSSTEILTETQMQTIIDQMRVSDHGQALVGQLQTLLGQIGSQVGTGTGGSVGTTTSSGTPAPGGTTSSGPSAPIFKPENPQAAQQVTSIVQTLANAAKGVTTATGVPPANQVTALSGTLHILPVLTTPQPVKLAPITFPPNFNLNSTKANQSLGIAPLLSQFKAVIDSFNTGTLSQGDALTKIKDIQTQATSQLSGNKIGKTVLAVLLPQLVDAVNKLTGATQANTTATTQQATNTVPLPSQQINAILPPSFSDNFKPGTQDAQFKAAQANIDSLVSKFNVVLNSFNQGNLSKSDTFQQLSDIQTKISTQFDSTTVLGNEILTAVIPQIAAVMAKFSAAGSLLSIAAGDQTSAADALTNASKTIGAPDTETADDQLNRILGVNPGQVIAKSLVTFTAPFLPIVQSVKDLISIGSNSMKAIAEFTKPGSHIISVLPGIGPNPAAAFTNISAAAGTTNLDHSITVGNVEVHIEGNTNMTADQMQDAVGKGLRKALSDLTSSRTARVRET